MPRAGVRRPVPPFFFTFEVEHGPAPRFGVQLRKSDRRPTAVPTGGGACRIVTTPRRESANAIPRSRWFRAAASRWCSRRVPVRAAGRTPTEPRNPIPPIRIDHEVSGHAVTEFSRDLERLYRSVHGRVFGKTGESLVGCRFETKEDVEFSSNRPPRFEQIGVGRHQIDTALDQDPVLANVAPPQFERQLFASRRMVPKKIVGDEDLGTCRREIARHRLDGSLAECPAEQLPYRAEVAAERTATGGFNQIGGLVVKARVPFRQPSTRWRAGSGTSSS